jgi:hypothetical protein
VESIDEQREFHMPVRLILDFLYGFRFHPEEGGQVSFPLVLKFQSNCGTASDRFAIVSIHLM